MTPKSLVGWWGFLLIGASVILSTIPFTAKLFIGGCLCIVISMAIVEE